MTGICITEHFDITPFNNKSKQNQPFKDPKINMTPTKYKQKDSDSHDEMGSPVLDSTALSTMQSKTFHSSTPAFNRAEPATAESKKSVLNILDQLCSPISAEESEEWQFISSIHEKNKKLTPASKKKAVTKISKHFSTDCNKPKNNSHLNKSSQESVKGNLDMTHNDLFDDISDISLQFLCEATNHIADNPKSNENTSTYISNNSDREVLNEENIYFCVNKEKDQQPTNLPLKISFNCNLERSELIDTVIFDNRKLIYSNTNFRLDAPSSIHLNDLFSEVKCLEEANKTFKKKLKPRDLQVASKAIRNKSTTFLNLSKNLDPVQSELETENKLLNDSLGISDTQFCEAVDAAELMSNLNTTFNTNMNGTGSNGINIEKIHQESRGTIKYCINNTKSEIPPSNCLRQRGKSDKMLEEVLIEGISLPNNGSSEPEPVLKGFQAGRGKLVKVSNNLLDKTKHLHHDSSYKQKLIPKCVQTPSGTSVEISEKSLKEAKCSLTDVSLNSEALLKDTYTVPNKSLIKTNTLLEDLSYESDQILEGFQTPSSKSVKTSEALREELTKMKCSLSHGLELAVNGFQTASGKSVKISEKSLEKAKQLFDDGTALKQQGFQTANGKSVKVSGEPLEKNKYSFNDELKLIQKDFKTASGEFVKIPEESLEKTKQLFDDQSKLIQKGFQTASGKSVQISAESLEKAKKLFDDGPKLIQKGFQTASGKSVEISADSLEKAKQLFDDGPNLTEKGFQTANGKSVKVLEESLEQTKQLFDDRPKLIQKGFQTASGKSVEISADSLEKAKQLFDDGPNLTQKGFETADGKSVKVLEESLEQTKQLFDDRPKLTQKGFQTASGKSVVISAESLEKAKQLFDDGPSLIQKGCQQASGKSFQISEESLEQTKQLFDDQPKLIPKGFQTASGKSVQISEESLEKAKQLFEDGPNLIQKVFQTASEKSVQISEESLEQTKQLFDDRPKLIQKGFQTASGKSVQISAESLKKAKQLFDDGPILIQKGFQQASGKSFQISEESLEQTKQLFDDQPQLIPKGFQTASGKSVQISTESLEKAKQLFDDGPNLIHKGFQQASEKSVQISGEPLEQTKQLFDDRPKLRQKGFQTSGKSVQISAESLKKAKQLFDDGPILIQKGFQQASGKSFQISEESLEQTKQSFDDQPQLIPKGFQTASGKSVQISTESLEKAKQLFDDGPNLIHKGFQQASEKSVQISGEPLEQTKQLFDDRPKLRQKGFQTSGKSVQISVESLEQAKSLFDDADGFLMQKGFLTASGKSVKVSEESLEKAKHLFDDGPNLLLKNIHPENEKAIEISRGPLRKVNNSINNISPKSELTVKRFQTLSRKPFKLSEESLKNRINLHDEVSFEPSLIKKGFQTASGKSVKLSEESLTKAQNFMNNISNETDILLKGYQSACGKSIGVAEGCSKTARNIFDNASHDPNSILKGFHTASRKSVKISEDSLKKAKNLLDNTTWESRPDLVPKMSKSPTKNSNKISEKILSTEEHLLSESFVAEPVLKGFQTVSGKYIDMSGNLLKKAMKTLDNASPKPQSESVFKAFQTASGKGVHISEESLKKGKHLFRDDHNETGDSLIIFQKAENKYVECNDSQKRTVFSIDKSSPKIDRPFAILSSRLSQVMQEENDISEVENVLQAEKVVFHVEVEKRKRKHPSQSDCSQMDKTLNNLTSKDSSLYENKKSHHNSLRKRRKLFIETNTTGQINEDKLVYNEENGNSIIGASVISEADLSLLNRSRSNLSGNENQINEHCSPDIMSPSVAREVSESMAALLADEATNSPFSLKPCVSSPGMLYERQVRLPSIDCYENEVHVNNNQLSPILGSRCGLNQSKHQTGSVSTPITLLHKTDSVNSKSSSFKPPYATSTPNESQLRSKRKSLYSNLQTQTEKRQKNALGSENETVYDVSKARLEAALKQEQYIKEKLKTHEEIKPCKGSYLLRKQTEKNRSLRDLTANRPLSLLTTQQLTQCGVKQSVQEIFIRNVMEFKFVAVHYFSKETAFSNANGIPIGDGAVLVLDGEGKAGVKEITRAFLASPSIDPSLISSEWVENHFKWIVLKMAAMERMFPHEFGNRYLTPNNLMLQLKYRYDREIDRSQRPALRKILEKDESPAKTMVLFVADILDAEVQLDKEKHGGRKELELSDGWYSVKATIDHEMEVLLRSKKVVVGTKLMITGAELSNNEAGCHPLETPANVRLRVSTNSTRRARWFAQLGFHTRSPRPARLREVLGRGGALPALTAAVARTYPVLFLEKVDGRTVIRSERAEQTAADEYQTKRQQCAEAVLSQLQRDLESSRSSKKHPVTRTLVKHATSTKHLYTLLDGVDDISFFQDVLSKEQLDEIQQLKEEEMRKVQQQLQDRLVDELDKEIAPRHVTRMLKLRLIDEEEHSDRSALLTVWNPPDDIMSCLTEGNLLTFYNISASGFSRFGDLQLTAGKQTKYSLQKHCSSPRRVTSLSELQDSEFKPRFSEVDLVGLVVQSTDSTPDKTSSLIYFADCNHNFIGVSFWTDLKATGYANTLTPGSLVATSNLHWRSHLVSWKLPSAYATEMSTFSQHPRQPHLQEALAQLRSRVQAMDLARYLESCRDRIKSLVAQRNCGGVQQESTSVGGSAGAVNVAGPTGSGANSGSGNQKLARDKVDSSVAENIETPTNRRLEMLERYGEPPPISPLSTSTPTSVKRSFRPPVRKFSEKR